VDATAETVEAARRRVAASPTDAEALFAFGTALWWTGEQEAGVAALTRAIDIRPDHAEARNNLGNALVELGRPDAAIPHYRAALAIRPNHAPTLYNLGNALLAAGQQPEAEQKFRAALAILPSHAGALNNLGNVLRAQGRAAEAEACYRQAVALRPDAAGSHNNLGSALLALHRPAEAAACFTEALRLAPDYAEACNNLGGALLALDRPEDAIPQFRRAVALDPAQAQARFGESLALLSLGRFREGWDAYESRWLDPRFCEGVRRYDAPRWHGAWAGNVAGRTVLVHHEQGLGDTIQFVRYLPMLRALGARVVLEAQAPLLRLLEGLADEVVAEGAALPPHDLCCPLLSLPRAFGTELASIPASVPYLRADPKLVAAWRHALGPATRLRVGIAFSGSADHPEDALRSIPAETLRPLLALPEVEFHVVQKDIRDADAATLRTLPGVRARAERLENFAETAALLTELHLVVSVDTSVAHLAGAMGLPVWVLVQSNADFRWLRGRTDSPWYPTARLFRQARALAWEREVAQVAEAVRGFAEGSAMVG
jgi:tetratricopeptide (TPR) repeat protein